MDKEFLKKCLRKGMSTRDIEKICDKKRSTISYWIKKYGLTDKSKYINNQKTEGCGLFWCLNIKDARTIRR